MTKVSVAFAALAVWGLRCRRSLAKAGRGSVARRVLREDESQQLCQQKDGRWQKQGDRPKSPDGRVAERQLQAFHQAGDQQHQQHPQQHAAAAHGHQTLEGVLLADLLVLQLNRSTASVAPLDRLLNFQARQASSQSSAGSDQLPSSWVSSRWNTACTGCQCAGL